MSKFGSAQIEVFLADGVSLLAMKAKELSTEEEAVQEETTGLGDDWAEFTPTGRRIARLSQGEAFYVGQAHELFMASQATNRVVCYGFEGDVIGKRFYGHEGAFGAKYKVLTQNGNLTKAQTEYVVSGQRDEGVILQNQVAKTADWNTEGAESVDNGASSANGGVGYLQVTALSGFTGFVGTIRHSADDVVYADLITFANVTAAPDAERIAVAGTVNRHLAFSGDVTGSGSITVFAGFARG